MLEAALMNSSQAADGAAGASDRVAPMDDSAEVPHIGVGSMAVSNHPNGTEPATQPLGLSMHFGNTPQPPSVSPNSTRKTRGSKISPCPPGGVLPNVLSPGSIQKPDSNAAGPSVDAKKDNQQETAQLAGTQRQGTSQRDVAAEAEGGHEMLLAPTQILFEAHSEHDHTQQDNHAPAGNGAAEAPVSESAPRTQEQLVLATAPVPAASQGGPGRSESLMKEAPGAGAAPTSAQGDQREPEDGAAEPSASPVAEKTVSQEWAELRERWLEPAEDPLTVHPTWYACDYYTALFHTSKPGNHLPSAGSISAQGDAMLSHCSGRVSCGLCAPMQFDGEHDRNPHR